MTTEHKPHSSYFSDRCQKTVFGNEMAMPCSLQLDHEGPCVPTPAPQSNVVSQHSGRIDLQATGNVDALRLFVETAAELKLSDDQMVKYNVGSLRGIFEQLEALAKVIIEADQRTQQPIDLNYIAIFKDDWHRIVGKVTPPATLDDLFVSNPASRPPA